jgi:hypothetical protein
MWNTGVCSRPKPAERVMIGRTKPHTASVKPMMHFGRLAQSAARISSLGKPWLQAFPDKKLYLTES